MYFTPKHLGLQTFFYHVPLLPATFMVSVHFFFLSRTGWFGTVVEYGAERKISRHSVLSATVSVGVPQGVTLKLKYWPTHNLISFSRFSSHFLTVHVCISVLVSRCRLARASQTYLFPVHLTDQLLPSAVFYATVGPLLVYMAIHRLIIIPYTRAQKEESVRLLCLLSAFLM